MRAKGATGKLQAKFITIGKYTFLAGVLVSVGLLSAFLSMRFAVRGTEVEVPEIQGRPAEQAKNILKNVGLRMNVSGESYDPKVSGGEVISQHPGAGVRIKVNREVQVILSLGVRRNPVPSLKGSKRRAAQSMILQSGYEVGYVSEVDLNGKGKDEVLQQFPAVGAEPILGATIDLLVNRSSLARYVMPDMTGQDLNQVIPFLEKEGLTLGKIQYRPHPNVPKGIVVRQFPEPGYMLRQNDSINLEVAR